QPVDGDGNGFVVENSLHQAQMNRAHDLPMALGEFREWAVPQADLLLSPRSAALGCKPELVEHALEVVDRVLRTGLRARWRSLSELSSPRTTRGLCLGGRITTGGKSRRQDLGEQPVMA